MARVTIGEHFWKTSSSLMVPVWRSLQVASEFQ